jgi:hypothetical protein
MSISYENEPELKQLRKKIDSKMNNKNSVGDIKNKRC